MILETAIFIAQRTSVNLQILWYSYSLEDPFEIWNELFYIIRFKEVMKVCPKCCWVNSHWYTNILFKNHATSRVKKHLFIDKSLFSEVSSSSSLRSPIDICFREANAFSDFRFADKIDNFWKQFYKEFFWDGCI